jgi:4-diphosphocytidyl-2-C-methyl-D-erythritol kinase
MMASVMTGDPVTVRVPAKVNLYLHVTGRRPDGRHELCSLFIFAGYGDALTIAPADHLSLTITGPFASALGGQEDNLVLRAARALRARAGRPAPGARLTLTKNLPVAAGLGGGSGDAAATLGALNRLWGLGLDDHALADLALDLGADVPACLAGRPVQVAGIGEQISDAPALPGFWLVLANPGAPAPTGAVFARFRRDGAVFSRPAPLAGPVESFDDLVAALAARANDLEAAACHVAPLTGAALAALRAAPACRLARMSGSGASCFGLFATPAAARAATARLRADHPDWWVVAAPGRPEAHQCA